MLPSYSCLCTIAHPPHTCLNSIQRRASQSFPRSGLLRTRIPHKSTELPKVQPPQISGTPSQVCFQTYKVIRTLCKLVCSKFPRGKSVHLRLLWKRPKGASPAASTAGSLSSLLPCKAPPSRFCCPPSNDR